MLYDEDPIIQEVTEDRIRIFFNGTSFVVNKGDIVSVLIDEHSGMEVTSMPKLEHVTFQELHDSIVDESCGYLISGEYGYDFSGKLFNICGIGRDT